MNTFKTSHSVLLPEGAAPEWMHILPSGTFHGRDGRGPWSCDPVAVVAATRAHNGAVDIPVDYDHQLVYSTQNGQPAPAAGWITELAARPDGIWGKVNWTDKGKAAVSAREYRYISPVYYHDANGIIQCVESVALTNVPNLTSLRAIASTAGHNLNPGDAMSLLKTLASVLGVADAEPTEAAVEAAVRGLVQDAQSMKSALSTLAQTVQSTDETPAGLVRAVQSVAARAEHPDASRFVPTEVFNAVNTELAQMKTAQSVALVAQAKAEGKISPALEDWAKALASRDPEAFKTFCSAAPDLRPGNKGTPKTTPPNDGKDKISSAERTMCRVIGISEESYLKAMQTTKEAANGSDE
ncbi:MAG: phage protease [Bilophila sp.]